MDEEILDIVNADDEIVSQIKRSEVRGRADIIIRTVAVVILDDEGSVLLQQRSKNKANNPLEWNIFACTGHVASGESVEIAATRELLEELSISAQTNFYTKEFNDNSARGEHSVFRYIYYVRQPGLEITQYDKNEIEQLKWERVSVVLNEANRYGFSEKKRQILAGITKQLGFD